MVAHVQLVMTDRSLLSGDDEPAWVPGVGPVPAGWARELLRPLATASTASDPGVLTLRAAEVWIRQLYADPETGELVAMRSRERRFPDALRGFLVSRDRICRTPWCDAPIRHADHVVRVSDGGDTSADNGDGLCEACNYARESGGWSAGPSADSRPGHHEVIITTPTGHAYVSRPPPLPGARDPDAPAGRGAPPERQVLATRIVTSFADLLHGAA